MGHPLVAVDLLGRPDTALRVGEIGVAPSGSLNFGAFTAARTRFCRVEGWGRPVRSLLLGGGFVAILRSEANTAETVAFLDENAVVESLVDSILGGRHAQVASIRHSLGELQRWRLVDVEGGEHVPEQLDRVAVVTPGHG